MRSVYKYVGNSKAVGRFARRTYVRTGYPSSYDNHAGIGKVLVSNWLGRMSIGTHSDCLEAAMACSLCIDNRSKRDVLKNGDSKHARCDAEHVIPDAAARVLKGEGRHKKTQRGRRTQLSPREERDEDEQRRRESRCRI